jgi:outer membrane protein OmpA-like peptidoglycan-associated protein
VKLSGSDDIVPQITDGSLPVGGIPLGAVVELPTGLGNVKAMSFGNGRVSITPTPGFSGIIRVPVVVKLGTAEFATEVVLTVLPDASPRVTIQNNRSGGLITWAASPTPTVVRYVVRVNGTVVCETDASVRSCQNALPIGPKSVVTVTSVGGDKTLSTLANGKNAEKCGTIGSVSFAPDSAKLSNAAKAKLREIASLVKRQGFKNLCLSGHTDARRSLAWNNDLSWWRARNVYSYLNKFLPAHAKVKLAYSGEHRPRATNETQPGMAKNRRVDIVYQTK